MRHAKLSIFILTIITLLTLPTVVTAGRAGSTTYDALISTRRLERGHVITRSDIMLVTTRKNDPRAVSDMTEVVGKRLKRTLGANTTIKRDYLLDALINGNKRVSRGDEVVIIVEMYGLRVTADGRLRESAKVGEMVETENLSSGKIITGMLINANTVVVNF